MGGKSTKTAADFRGVPCAQTVVAVSPGVTQSHRDSLCDQQRCHEPTSKALFRGIESQQQELRLFVGRKVNLSDLHIDKTVSASFRKLLKLSGDINQGQQKYNLKNGFGHFPTASSRK